MDAGLAHGTAQRDAASEAGFGAFHADQHGTHGADQFIGHGATGQAREFAHVHRDSKVLAACAARETGVVLGVDHIDEDALVVLDEDALNDDGVPDHAEQDKNHFVADL